MKKSARDGSASRFEKLFADREPDGERSAGQAPISDRHHPPVRIGYRAGGKKSDPAFHQFTYHLRRDVQHAVKLACARRELDMSELVEDFWEKWLLQNEPADADRLNLSR